LGERARDIGDLMTQNWRPPVMSGRASPACRGRTLRPRIPGQALPHPRAKTRPQRPAPARRPAYRLPVVGRHRHGHGRGLIASGVRARGLTIATRPGAQVVAPAEGRVVFAGPYKGFDQIVIIDHGGGWASLVTDLARLSARVGQSVSQGEPLGVAASTAHPTITVELRRQGRPVDIVAMTGAGA
jgi:septal ring factor EnvC (AmiA/AmiB activator)